VLCGERSPAALFLKIGYFRGAILMAKRVLSIIKCESKGFECLPCERLNLDIERFSEYRDSDEHPAETPFENPPLKTSKKAIVEAQKHIPTILHYFLDGSRRTYKVADLVLGGRYLPLIAGQVGVSVVERVNSEQFVKPVREFCHFKNVLAFPNLIAADDLNYLQSQINQQGRFKFELMSYTVKKERNLVDLGIAKIMSEMHNLEIAAVQEMAKRNLLRNDRLLVIDGPLRFKKSFDIVQFRNVIGLSKSFRPSFTVGRGRRKVDVGALTSALMFGERTSVFKTTDVSKTIGMWYVCIRPRNRMTNPLQGIVKMECYAMSEEQEDGLDSQRVDVISSHLLRERNVTPYQADRRWASHIYPIYLAEQYVKSSFVSDTQFRALF